jgi:formylglycine-generating enzyme required for sulfatase activity
MLRAAVIVLLIALLPSPVRAEARIALVITNQAYTQAGARLSNTYHDGEVINAALERVGFKVWVIKDTKDERALLQAVAEHVQRLAEAGPDAVGFLYYSGHGAADRPNGENFLIPTDVPLTHASQLPLLAVRLEKITSTLAGAGKMSFVVFDACRNVPLLRETKDLAFKGFAPVREQNGLLVAFATEPGNVAVDQSLYAKALADAMVTPGLEAGQVFRRVRLRVRADTGLAQSPEYLDKRDRDFSFVEAAQVAMATPPAPSPTLRPVATCDGVEARVGNEMRCLMPKDSFRDCSNCPEMVVVPAGSFTMGSPAYEPERNNDEAQVGVSIRVPFAVGKYAVTFDEWDACVADGDCNGYKPVDQGWGRGKHPVINVDWDDAKAYVYWLSGKTDKVYRLLSEAEREYVARARTTTPFWWGSAITPRQANYNGNFAYGGSPLGEYLRQTLLVDSFEPNPWGLYQVHGNIWEWTEDCSNGSNVSNPGDGRARTTGGCGARAVRGGSWFSLPSLLRSAYRRGAGGRGDDRGFRLARTLRP